MDWRGRQARSLRGQGSHSHSSPPDHNEPRGVAAGASSSGRGQHFQHQNSWEGSRSSSRQVLELPHSYHTWPNVKVVLHQLMTSRDLADAKNNLVMLNYQVDHRHNTISLENTPYYNVLTVLENIPELKQRFIQFTLGQIAQWALAIEHNCTRTLDKMADRGEMKLSRETAASMLACSFLCLFSARPGDKKCLNFKDFFCTLAPTVVYADPPAFGFGEPTMKTELNHKLEKQIEKLKFFLNYFEQIGSPNDTPLHGGMLIQRIALGHTQRITEKNLDNCFEKLCDFRVKDKTKLEESGGEAMIVDFANKHIGGGVLRTGSVQEEILFLTCPELIVTIFLTTVMRELDAIIVRGFTVFSSYSGYAESLRFEGPSHLSRVTMSMCAIDATPYPPSDHKSQYESKDVLREMNKAYAGFLQPGTKHSKQRIATGNWGCGAFGGDPQLKAMLQWISASIARCPGLIYHTYERSDMVKLETLVQAVQHARWNVGQLWAETKQYCSDKTSIFPKTKGKDLFTRLMDCLSVKK